MMQLIIISVSIMSGAGALAGSGASPQPRGRPNKANSSREHGTDVSGSPEHVALQAANQQ